MNSLLLKEKEEVMFSSDEHPYSLNLYILYGIGIFFLLVSFLLPIIYWQSIPDRVPMHFDLFGKADSWDGKGTLLIFPVVSLITFGVLSLVVGSPHANYPFRITEENAERQYAIARRCGAMLGVWVAIIFTFLEWMIIRIAQGKAQDLGQFAPFFLGVIVLILIDYLVRAYRAR